MAVPFSRPTSRLLSPFRNVTSLPCCASHPRLCHQYRDFPTGGGGDAHFNTVASCHSFAACPNSFLRYESLPRRGLIRDANRARISGLETVATQHDSPNFHWRIPVSSIDEGSFRPVHNLRAVGGNIHVPREVLLGQPNREIGCLGESHSWAFRPPKRRSK